ncbi:MAG: DNA-3-methyladenine glycosylase [Phycisphaerales bacterium]
MSPRAERSFFACDAEALARRLLGQTLVRRFRGRTLRGRIVETEAYVGAHDAASHAYKGRMTERNRAMFADPGVCYVYFTYGMHHCFNLSCGALGDPQAVLLRALEPLDGHDVMRELRDREDIADRLLCRGPANLAKAFAIERSVDGVDTVTSDELYIELVRRRAPRSSSMGNTPRIGISHRAGAWRDKPLRWYLRDSRSVSGSR